MTFARRRAAAVSANHDASAATAAATLPQTREIELMREELVRLRARTFPSFAQLSSGLDPIPDTVA